MRLFIRNIICLFFLSAISSCSQNQSVIWSLDNSVTIGGYIPVVIGDPRVEKSGSYTSIVFNGLNDGIILPVNPVSGWNKFTVEVLFRPFSGGLPAQRFVHFQDINGNRGLIETRLSGEGTWWLDTYLHIGETDQGLTLVDRTKQHPCDGWYWAAMVYDGKTMKHFVNANEECSGEIEMGPFQSGIISLGVRLSQVFWFSGQISEIRFHPDALEAKVLQKTDISR